MLKFDEELHRIIMIDQTHTICETCDMVFLYVPQKQFCDGCRATRALARRRSKEENKLHARQWRKNNPGASAAISRRYRAKKKREGR